MLALAVSDMLVRGVGNADVSMAVIPEQRVRCRFHREDEARTRLGYMCGGVETTRNAAGLAGEERKDVEWSLGRAGQGHFLCEMRMPGDLPGIGGR